MPIPMPLYQQRVCTNTASTVRAMKVMEAEQDAQGNMDAWKQMAWLAAAWVDYNGLAFAKWRGTGMSHQKGNGCATRNR
jgi:hypothetical protein